MCIFKIHGYEIFNATGIQKNSIAFSINGCQRSFNQMPRSSANLLFLAVSYWVSNFCDLVPYVSKNLVTYYYFWPFLFDPITQPGKQRIPVQPGKQRIPACCIDILTYPLFNMNLAILLAMTPKKDFSFDVE